MSKLSNLFSKIGEFFRGLFNAANRTWKQISPEVQNSLRQGSGILQIINQYLERTPEFVIKQILKKYPEVTREVLQEGLVKISGVLNITDNIVDDDLGKTIKNLQLYLSTLKSEDGKKWAGIISFAAKVLASFFAPKETKWAVFESLMEFVYQKFVKK